MKRKPWIIGIAAVLFTVFAVKGVMHYRWSRLSAGEKAGAITEKMTRRFDLDAGQKAKIYALNLEKMKAVETARHSGKYRRAEWKALHQQWRDDVREVLTPEQRERFCN